jgi:hypothetical protein
MKRLLSFTRGFQVAGKMGQSHRCQNQQEETAKMRRGIHVQIVMATILLSVLVLLIPMSVSAVNVGDKAPDFLAFDTVGESTRLSDYQGKKNVLMFFFVRAFGGV